MKTISLALLTLLAQPTLAAPKDYFGTWTIKRVREVRQVPPANNAQAEAWIGKTLSIAQGELTHGDSFLWFQDKCESPRYRVEPYRQTLSDPTKPADYGLKRFPREAFVIKCVWADGKLTPTFSFEIVGPNLLTIYWDGDLLFLERG